jgi:hypothetical protein
VTLTGTVDRQKQRAEAELVAGNVFGVLGLVNEIRLTTPVPYAGDVQESIRTAFERLPVETSVEPSGRHDQHRPAGVLHDLVREASLDELADPFQAA